MAGYVMDPDTLASVQRWLKKAENDLRTASTMLQISNPTTDTVSFHAQQCAEKVLKAYLVAKNVHVEKTHSIPVLVERCRDLDPEFERLAPMAPDLTIYAVTARYPDDDWDITEEEAQHALIVAEEFMKFIREKLGY